MNYFAHARSFLNQPYIVAGTAVPDWLCVIDRRARLRLRHAEAFRCDDDPTTADVARGVVQHLADDARFHATRAFAETSLELTVLARDVLGGETGLRPAFLGHLLTELLLDAALIAEEPDRLTEYYRAMDAVDPARVEAAVLRMAPRPVEGLADFIALYLREKILWNYLEDAPLMARLNQIMRRVRQPSLPAEFAAMLPSARAAVAERKTALMDGIPAQDFSTELPLEKRAI